MTGWKAESAAEVTDGEWRWKVPELDGCGFAIDTRRMKQGDVFVALHGEARDGHDYVAEAARLGARAALVERPLPDIELPQLVVEDSLEALQALARRWRERFTRPVVGITGSYGKTTVKELLARVMGGQWHRTEGNFNNHIGVPLTLLRLDPDRHAGAIIEAGINGPGQMDILADLIQPDHVLITAIGAAHLEELGDLEGVAREKAKLGAQLKPGGHLVLHNRERQYAAFAEWGNSDGLRPVSVTLGEAPEAKAPSDSSEYFWTEDAVDPGLGLLSTNSPFPGSSLHLKAGSPGMVENLALIVEMAKLLGVPDSSVEARLEGWQPPRQRGEIQVHEGVQYFVDCYNANPQSLIDSAAAFTRRFKGLSQLYILGEMKELGIQSGELHESTGKSLPIAPATHVYLVGAEAAAIGRGLELQGHPAGQIHLVTEPLEVKAALKDFSEGAVFLKGSRACRLEQFLPEAIGSC
jgi:UDP-N-acetylmuramoyl-tripeptide--D-alanyl-D-alanine ligase